MLQRVRPRPAASLAPMAGLFVLYLITGRLGLMMEPVSGYATPVWPPSGLSLVALTLFGCRLWPGVALAAFLVNRFAGAPVLSALGMAAGNTLEAVLGAYLLQRVVRFRPSMDRLRDVLGLIVFAAGLSTLVSATLGVSSGWLGGVITTARWGETWRMWWLGDMTSDLVLAPVLFLWSGRPRPVLSSRRLLEAGALLISLLVVAGLVFTDMSARHTITLPYLLFPFLIWAALRFGQHGAATALFLVSWIAIGATGLGLGPFARPTLPHSLFLLQSFTSVAAVTVLLLAADAAERERAAVGLREVDERLMLLLEASQAMLGSLELPVVLSGVLAVSRRLIAADAYAVWRQEDGKWSIVSASGLSETYQRASAESYQRASVGGLSFEKPLLAEDVRQVPLLAANQAALRAEGIESLLLVPLRIRGLYSGTLVFYYRQPRRFSETEVRVATGLGNLSAAAIGTADLYERQRQLRSAAERAMTERHRAEAALQQSEEQYRRIVDTTNEGIWLIDAALCSVFLNHQMAEMLGYTVEEMLGRSLFDFIPEEERSEVERRLGRRRQGDREQFEGRYRRKDGSLVWTQVSTSPLLDPDGQFLGALAMFTDITQRKEAEAALWRERGGFYVVGGTLQHNAPCYIERQADRDLCEGLHRGEFCYVLTTRQMGKSSLVIRTAARLRQEGAAVVFLDLTAMGQDLTIEQWYSGLLEHMGRQLDLEDELDAFELEPAVARLGPLQRWMAALRDVVLKVTAMPPLTPAKLVIFIDEIDVVRSLPFSTDEFFAAIRACYNLRSEQPAFHQLTFCLSGVATPSDLIQDPHWTPFNIGRRIELTDFTAAEAAPLALGFSPDLSPGPSPARGGGAQAEGGPGDASAAASAPPSFVGKGDGGLSLAEQFLQRILYWTGGHPYLTQRLCQAVAEEIRSQQHGRVNGAAAALSPASLVDRLCEVLFFSPGCWERDDNLLLIRDRLLRSGADRTALLALYAQVVSGRRVKDADANPNISTLWLSGVVRRVDGCLHVRNRIYERVFDPKWVSQHLPGVERRRPRPADFHGCARAVAVTGGLAALASLALAAVRRRRAEERGSWDQRSSL